MASTNKTTNYELSQFEGTDKPSWEADYNADMLAIDTNLKAVSDVADGASGSISSLADRVTAAEGNITTNANDIDALEARADALEAGETAADGRLDALEAEQIVQNTAIESNTRLGYNLARPYDSASTYSVGAYVLFQDTLYKCTTAIATGEAFDPTKWLAIKATDEIAAGGYTLPTASASTLGGVKVGNNLSIDANGILSGLIPIASANDLGGVKIGNNLSIDNNGVLSANTATISTGNIPLLGVAGDRHYGTWNNYGSVSIRPVCNYYKIGNLVYIIATVHVSCLGASTSSGFYQFTVDTDNIPSELYTANRINIPLSVYIHATIESEFQSESHSIYNANITYQKDGASSSVSYLTIYSHTITSENVSVGGNFTLTGFFYLPDA